MDENTNDNAAQPGAHPNQPQAGTTGAPVADSTSTTAPSEQTAPVAPTDEPQDHTFGQKAVGLRFNPSGNELVTNLKTAFAAAIDICHTERVAATDGEVKRQYSVAITDLQTAQMWAVKAATWNL